MNAIRSASGAIMLGGLALLLSALVDDAARSQETASQWVRGYRSEARLLAGGRHGGALLIGVHIKMDKGWKTYWRTPGDAGLPPAFDWSQSDNLKSATVLWPAPRRFEDGSGKYAGYKKEVVFPIRLLPKAAGEPIVVKLDLQYAICAEICVPAEAQLNLTVTGKDGSAQPLVERFLARVPERVSGPQDTLPYVAGVTAELAAAEPRLIVEARFPSGLDGADLLVEGPEGTYVPMARTLGPSGEDAIRYEVDLGRGVLTDVKGKPLLFTLVSESGQSETIWRVPE